MAIKLIILSIATFLLGCSGVGLSLYVIIAEEKYHHASLLKDNRTHHLEHVFQLCLNKGIIDLVTGMILLLSIFAMAFSVFLFVGVRKGQLGFVLAYFAYGIVLLILFIVSALLEFLQGGWPYGLITLIISAIYSNCLTDVYKFYDTSKHGIEFETGHSLLINEDQADNEQC